MGGGAGKKFFSLQWVKSFASSGTQKYKPKKDRKTLEHFTIELQLYRNLRVFYEV